MSFFVSVMAPSETAFAGGVEYVGQGTRALGRGGAFAARADDPMALSYNPAALVELEGGQVMLNMSNAFYDACVTRFGSYGQRVEQNGTTDRFGDFSTYRGTTFPRVCQNNLINPGLWAVVTQRYSDTIGYGFGILTPAAAGHLIWGDGEGATKNGDLPSPVRYQLVEQDIKLINPTFGVGVKADDYFRLGVSLQWGIAVINELRHTSQEPTENPNEDIRSELSVKDLFIPALIFSAHFVPMDAVDLVFSGRVSDDIRARGELKLESPAYNDQKFAVEESDSVTVQAAVPSEFGFSARYADRVNPREGGERGDPMKDERWDLELDAMYIMSSQFRQISVDVPTLPMLAPEGLHFDLPHRWKNQLSLRVGGDYNLIPSVLAVRGGLHYETTALRGSYIGIDFQPAQRLGVHLGGTWRVGSIDVSLAYAHIFQETITVPNNNAAYPQVVRPDRTKPDGGFRVNAGKYESGYNVVSLGATYRF